MSAPIIAGYNFTLSVEGHRTFRSVRSRQIAFGVTTLVAALLVGGGLYFDAPPMMWSGVAVVVVEGMVYFALKKVRERRSPSPHAYRSITHNPGPNGCCSGKPWMQGVARVSRTTTRQEQFIKQIRHYYSDVDLIGMQESGDTFSDTFLRGAMPTHEFRQNPAGEGTERTRIGKDTLVGWNKKKFTLLGEGTITYRPLVGQSRGMSLSSQFVLLRDKETGKNIIFISAHIDGFLLADTSKNATGPKPTLESGNEQLSQIISYLNKAVDCYDVDQIIIGMDANCDPFLGPSRFDILQKAGYVVSLPTREGTFFDAGLKEPITVDYIACWTRGVKPVIITVHPPDVLTYGCAQGISDDRTAVCAEIRSD